MKSKLFIVVALSLFGFQNAHPQTALPPDMDEYVARVLETFEVPGMAVAIVKDGRVLLAKGYGVREMGKPDRVDEHTLFPIASNSKAFTATALALLVEAGKLEWDKPVIDYLPWFRLADPYVTSELSVRDLLVHRSGIAPYAGDLMQFPPTTYTRRELVERLRYLPLSTSFRSTYAYDNVLYLVAGLLIEEVSGLEWEDFVAQRIFPIVGMTGSSARFSTFEAAANRASSHAPVEGRVKLLDEFFEQGLGDISNPAGGITSNAVDMAKWLVTQLDSGRTPTGKTLLPPNAVAHLWQGVTPMPVSTYPPRLARAQTDLPTYALGFRVYANRGAKAVVHGGKLDGFVSQVWLYPERKFGIAVLTNQESGNAYYTLMNHVLDYAFGEEPYDWLAAYRKSEDLKFERISAAEQAAHQERDSTSTPSLPLSRYAGTYRDQWYGDITITQENGELIMRFNQTPLLVGTLEHWQYDTFVVRWHHRDLRADAYVTFTLDPQGQIAHVAMKAVSPITDVSYDFHDLDIYPVPERMK